MKLTDKIPSAVHRVVVYGPPKSGKTELVGALSSKFKLIWFDLENGYVTLKKLPAASQANIELISIPDTKDYPIAIETMLKVIKGAAVSICEEHGKVACPLCTKNGASTTTVELRTVQPDTIVVIDSLTQISNSIIAQAGRGKPIDFQFTYTEWLNVKAHVESFLSNLQQAWYNVVCISHEEEVEMEDGSKKIVPVCGSSKSSRNTAKYFDHVVYCNVKNRKHNTFSDTLAMNSILTGSRTDAELEKDGSKGLFDIFSSTELIAPTPGQVAVASLKSMTAITTGATVKS